jgi:phosphopantetheinyl transferase
VVFAALGCGADRAAAAIDGLEGVVVSHDNCPHQSIVCGDQAAVTAALDRLRQHGVGGQVLPFRSGFHSPMLAPYLGPIRDSVDRLPLRTPAIPVWSATTVAPYPTVDGAVRDLVVRHLVEPVRFGPLVARLAAEGARAFVQVGTGSLPGFIDDTLAGRDHLAVSANTPKRSGLDQLRRVAAALWTEGLAPRFDRLPRAAPPAPAEPRGRTVRLDLGAPLVRLGDSVVPLVTASRMSARVPAGEPPAAGGHPVLAEFDAVLRDATAAVRDVVGSWQRGTADRRPQAAAGRRRATTTRVLSVETMPFLADHCLYRQPPGWPEESDRYPVVPMTTTLELMMDAARDLVPDRTVVGIQGVRALRWLAVAPPVRATIDAALDEAGNVKVVIEGYARGTVVLADGYPAPADRAGPPAHDRLADRPLTAGRPCEVSPELLYADRWMFHGPRFQGVAELGPIGDDGIRGVLTALAAPGALLDNAGQLMGFWVMANVSRDRLALPSAVERVWFHGPHPRPGERVSCAVRIRSVTDAEVAAEMELRTAGGRLWCRVEGWRDRRFDTDELTWPVYRFPEVRRVAEAQPGGWFLVRERWPDSATRELMMRRYLGAAERAEYEQLNPRAQRQWLLGRIAVKDAARQWLWDRGAGPVFPVEVGVDHDGAGRPRVRGPFAEPVEVSLAHTGSLAVAIVSRAAPDRPASGLGIDIERVTERDGGFETTAFTAAERALLDRLCAAGGDPRACWVTRFQAAKEAAAKAEGTALAGHPERFAVAQADGDRLLVGPPGAGRRVDTRLLPDLGPGEEQHAVAWTVPIGQPAPAGATAWHGGHRRGHRGGHADDN